MIKTTLNVILLSGFIPIYENSPVKEHVVLRIEGNLTDDPDDNWTNVDVTILRYNTTDMYARTKANQTDHYHHLGLNEGLNDDIQALFDHEFFAFYQYDYVNFGIDKDTLNFSSKRDFEACIAYFKEALHNMGGQSEFFTEHYGTEESQGSVFDVWHYERQHDPKGLDHLVEIYVYRCTAVGKDDTENEVGQVTGYIVFYH